MMESRQQSADRYNPWFNEIIFTVLQAFGETLRLVIQLVNSVRSSLGSLFCSPLDPPRSEDYA